MVRFEIHDGPLSVAFGHDTATGVFLSVSDEDLRYSPIATRQVNNVAEAIGVGDGGGSYVDLHTGPVGFGVKVDDATMKTYLERFGASEDEISMLPLKLPRPTRVPFRGTVCMVCRNPTRKECSICAEVHYCSQDCQRHDWPVHKIFCKLQVEPADAVSSSSQMKFTKAVLFPEQGDSPTFVYLPVEWQRDGGYWRVITSEFIAGGFPDNCRSDTTYGHCEDLEYVFQILWGKNTAEDGQSKENMCLQRVQKKYLKTKEDCLRIKGIKTLDRQVFWRNNILVVKFPKPSNSLYDLTPDRYEDVSLSDIPDIVEFVVKSSLMYLL
ncbi:MYND finger [Seminavis robusta]|uniref:MYND finger n=1 Tax=Seminavis robusta TaxID=568900 RepID=A0A9N8DYM0_9STRA|nr:MYND finger [Seminavis robusta]|eukprot:Sro479_g151240.1 MYND finger (324) ;mRNA; f:48091-49062